LWYRGLIPLPPPEEPALGEPQIDEILKAQAATAMIVAHTTLESGRVLVRFGGKVVDIDTGMQPEHAPKGRGSALEIKGRVFTAIYPDKREVVAGPGAIPENTYNNP